MKPKCFLFLVLLGFGRLGLTVSSFDESNVKSYHLERRPGNNPDLFVVKLKSDTQCVNCKSLKAHFHGKVLCSCTCPSDNPTFLPSLRLCTSQRHLPANFTGDVKVNIHFRLSVHVHTRFSSGVRVEGGFRKEGLVILKHPKTGCTFHPDPISLMINRNFPSQS